MPTISMFYGILVAIFFEDNDRHGLPHIVDWELAVAGEQPFPIAPLQ